MSIPQEIIDALNLVQTDADAVTAAIAEAAVSAAASKVAQAKEAVDAAAVLDAEAKEAAALAALQALLAQVYGPGSGKVVGIVVTEGPVTKH